MADDPKIGDLLIDLRGLASFLKDLPDGALARLRPEKDGFDDVKKEILGNQELWGARGGVTGEDVGVIVESSDRIEQIDKLIPVVAKGLEMLRETRASEVDRREKKLTQVAEKVELNARHNNDTEVLAKYELALKYRSQRANKAAQTRRRNAANAEERARAEQIELKATAILATLAARNLGVNEEQKKRIEETEDLALLDRWLVRAATAATTAEVLA